MAAFASVRDSRTMEPGEPSATPGAEPLLLDRLMPAFDAVRVEHRIVAGGVETAYQAVKQADFVEAWRCNAAVRALFAARTLAERGVAVIRGRAAPEPPEAGTYRLADMPTHGEWVLLGEDPPREIAFGVVGRFWAGETTWEEIDAGDFESFDRPGLAKIAANFSVLPYGEGRSLVSYECRTKATDDAARRGFLRYWRPLSPFIGLVMRSALSVIEKDAGKRAGE